MQDRFQRSRLSLEMKLLDSKTKEEMYKKEMHEMKQQLVQKDDQIMLSTKKGFVSSFRSTFPAVDLANSRESLTYAQRLHELRLTTANLRQLILFPRRWQCGKSSSGCYLSEMTPRIYMTWRKLKTWMVQRSRRSRRTGTKVFADLVLHRGSLPVCASLFLLSRGDYVERRLRHHGSCVRLKTL